MNNKIKQLNQKIKNLELAYEGVLAEYQYVVERKCEKQNQILTEEKQKAEYYKKEFEEAVKKLQEVKLENEIIKNSKWWKIREKLKGN